jgi:hypothetical protein
MLMLKQGCMLCWIKKLEYTSHNYMIFMQSYVLSDNAPVCRAITRFNFESSCSFKPLAVSSSLTRITRE